ncbi:hypothetical protein U1Q18_005199 [Sarracenia purpurea var. burkii]
MGPVRLVTVRFSWKVLKGGGGSSANRGAARGFPPQTGSKRKFLGLSSSTKSGKKKAVQAALESNSDEEKKLICVWKGFRRRRNRQRCLLWKDRQTEEEKSPELQVRQSQRRRGSSPISSDLGLGQVGDRCGLEDVGGLIKCRLTRAQWFFSQQLGYFFWQTETVDLQIREAPRVSPHRH